MRNLFYLFCAVLIFALCSCGVEDDFKNMKERELIVDLKAEGQVMPLTEVCELYGGVAFYNNDIRKGYATWFVRDGKVYAINEAAQEITPKAICAQIPSVWEAFMPANIEKTIKNPPKVTTPHTGQGSADYYVFLKNEILPKAGGTIDNSSLTGAIKQNGKSKAGYQIREEGGYITYLGLSCYLSKDKKEREKQANSMPLYVLLYTLKFYLQDETIVESFLPPLMEPVLAGTSSKVSQSHNGLTYTFSLINDYSKLPSAEVPEYIKHIKKPVVISLEIQPE